MHYFKFHGHPDEPPTPKARQLYLRTANYLAYEAKRPGEPWQPSKPVDGWSLGSRNSSAEEAENA